MTTDEMSTFPFKHGIAGIWKQEKKNGASDRNRTGDNHVGNVMLYQLSYTRTCVNSKNGASDRNRTGDNHVGNVMLYQLSYTRTFRFQRCTIYNRF